MDVCGEGDAHLPVEQPGDIGGIFPEMPRDVRERERVRDVLVNVVDHAAHET